MLRISVLSTLLISSIAFAHHHDRHERVGSAIHTGTGEVWHNGDYVEFTLDFSASCLERSVDARTAVVGNVAVFESWLHELRTTVGYGEIDYNIGLINIGRNNDWDAEENDPCYNRYDARQYVEVRLSRLTTDEDLSDDVVQNFFNEIQLAVGPLNSEGVDDNPNATIAGRVTSVDKGIWEETNDNLRIAAKAKARAQATRDFLAFLGPDYPGAWHLHSVDFSDNRYSGGGLSTGVAMEAPGGQSGEGPALSVLKLRPLSVDVEGEFLFHFDIFDDFIPNA